MPRVGPLLALVLLALTGQAASVGTIHIPDPAGDPEFDASYWVLRVGLPPYPMVLVPPDCRADNIDIRSVDAAVLSDGAIRGSMSLADLDARLHCPSTGTPLDPVPFFDPGEEDAHYELYLSAGNATRPHGISLELTVRADGEHWMLRVRDSEWPPLCLDGGWWREGDTIGFTVPPEGTGRRCEGGPIDDYSFRGTTMSGEGFVWGSGARYFRPLPANMLGWWYHAIDDAQDPTQRISVP